MGKVIGIRNGNIVILYGHLSKFHAKLGQIVSTGDLIGLSGNTGTATTAPHLHFELRDWTRYPLKDMVFKPLFGHEIKQHKETFSKTIYNQTTPKTLRIIVIHYFGSEKYLAKILAANPNLSNNPDEVIKDNTKIAIPNF